MKGDREPKKGVEQALEREPRIDAVRIGADVSVA